MPKLVIALSESERQAHELTDDVITIGRGPENVIRLEDPSVSGRHAQMHGSGDAFELKDLDSTNGTRVNGKPITSVVLRPGDQIRFGKVEACYECEVPGEAQELPTLETVEALPAEVSAKPADFGNASPFPKRSAERDPSRTAVFAAAAVAILAFLGSMVAVALMRPPLP